MIRISAEICARCKGYKKLCGLSSCPLMIRYRTLMNIKNKIPFTKEFKGYTPPSGVVSEAYYPNVSLIYSIPPESDRESARAYDDPVNWWGKYDLDNIISLRSSMVSGIIKINVKEPEKLIERDISLALVSEKPVDSELYLKKIPNIKIKIDPFDSPRGLGAEAEKLVVSENPHVPRSIEKILWDDMKASEAVIHLYRNNLDVYMIQRAFSLGLLGRINRRLVPTRWAITAVDTILSLYFLKQIKDSEDITEGVMYKISYLGNRFWIALLPGVYSFNWIEIWHPRTLYTKTASSPVIVINTEDWRGEAEYMDGGYQAARFSVLEYLYKIRRRASVLVVREITPEYYAPVGNWHIRESIRRAFQLGESIKISGLEDVFRLLRNDLGENIVSEIASMKKDLRLYKDLVNKKLDQFIKKS